MNQETAIKLIEAMKNIDAEISGLKPCDNSSWEYIVNSDPKDREFAWNFAIGAMERIDRKEINAERLTINSHGVTFHGKCPSCGAEIETQSRNYDCENCGERLWLTCPLFVGNEAKLLGSATDE